jgi:hypothetical protein
VASRAAQLSATLRAHSPWTSATCGLPAATLFIFATAIGARMHEGSSVSLEAPGTMLAAAISACAVHPSGECDALVATIAAAEARAPESSASKEQATALARLTCGLLGGCEGGAAQWVMTLALAVWRLLGPEHRSGILWQLVQLLMHADVRVEIAAADALRRLAGMQGVPLREMLVEDEHVMREAGLHAATHQQVRMI